MSHEHKNVPRDRDNSLPIAADTAVARIDRLRNLRMSERDPDRADPTVPIVAPIRTDHPDHSNGR